MLVKAGEFKAKCLKLMDTVEKNQIEIIVTKRGRPVTKLVPYRPNSAPKLFGYLQDLAIIHEDIIEPTGAIWNAESE